jgi:hypothetical protein
MIDCEKGMNKVKVAKAMVSMCHRSCLPAPTRWTARGHHAAWRRCGMNPFAVGGGNNRIDGGDDA